MSEPLFASHPATGLYEQLITQRLQDRIDELREQGWRVIEAPVAGESSTHILARHVSDAIQQQLSGLTTAEQVLAANIIMNSLSTTAGAKKWIDLVAEGPRQVVALTHASEDGALPIRPSTPLSDAALLTNETHDLSLGGELRAELATADSVDLICAFVKWHGIRTLQKSLDIAKMRGVPIRVITTTYMGATERRALDRLVREYGAQVKINYETRSTRLHAKAWLFRRNSSYDTAYVGSSNLSKAALLDGLEWNVRLSTVATPTVISKFEGTFESYWDDPTFETYDPDQDAGRLDEALRRAGWSTQTDQSASMLTQFDVHPYPHQQDMLERLAVEREVHGWKENLLVAATGTGKTVMAALDYSNLRRKANRDLNLLFVAHRKEILTQSRQTYRAVLKDENFGELYVDGNTPENWRHVFASAQSLKPHVLDGLDPKHFDVIVIDEFHHATARTYRKIIRHFTPAQLLGLTATPERRDGEHVQIEYFDGRIAAEMRLWEALSNDLLSPFHYFGIADNVDMAEITWKRGGYDTSELDNLFTGNHARAKLIVDAVRDKVSDPSSMRALGFCVSVEHAYFMADFFRKRGIKAKALDGSTPTPDRQATLDELKQGKVQVLFSVDLFNEGLDIPDVDTLLFLRPTSSVTVFLQQLGRGLRRTPNKAVLTVLDFVGQHRKEYPFEDHLRALTNLTRGRLVKNIEADFPDLPAGYEIILDRKSKERIIANINTHLKLGVRDLAREVRSYGISDLAAYLSESGRDITEIYRNNHSWTELLREADLLTTPVPRGERDLLRRMTAFLHVDDPERVAAYTRLLTDNAPNYEELSEKERAYARMLYFTLWPKGCDGASYQDGLKTLLSQADFRDEACQVLMHSLGRADHLPIPLPAEHASIPLRIHSSYNREEILAALGEVEPGGFLPGFFNGGVRWCKEKEIDALLVTLEKNEKDFTPGTRYNDYAVSPTRFHSESQGTTPESSPTGQRYQFHRSQGSHVFLFVRRYKETDIGSPHPWVFLGPADYVRHTGSKPMGITWDLHHEMPADIWTYSAAKSA